MSETQDYSEDAYGFPGNEVLQLTPRSTTDLRPLTLKTNRAVRIFETAFENVRSALEQQAISRCFCYWDTYYKEKPDMSDVPQDAIVYKMIERRILVGLSDKKALAKKIQSSEHQHIAPTTFWSMEEARAYDSSLVNVWFIKNATSTGGKNMRCITSNELKNTELGRDEILQVGVDNVALIDGKKFTARVYVLVWNSQYYLFHKGHIVIHGVDYIEGSTDYKIQIDHNGYMDTNSSVKLCPLDEFKALPDYWPTIRSHIKDARGVLGDCIKASSETDFVILGIDLVLQSTGGVKLIEINTSPNFVHVNSVVEQVNIPLIESTFRTLAGLPANGFERL